MTTYRRVDGKGICDEYEFVTTLQFFEMDSASTDLIEEIWRLVSERRVTVNPDNDDDEEGRA